MSAGSARAPTQLAKPSHFHEEASKFLALGIGAFRRLAIIYAMNTSSLELLERTQLPPAQARAILQVMELELASRDGELATLTDLRGGLHGLELKHEALRTEIQALRGDFRTEIQSVRAELIREIKGTVRWNFAFWVAQLAAIAGILRLVK
jgi:hypothetical protein